MERRNYRRRTRQRHIAVSEFNSVTTLVRGFRQRTPAEGHSTGAGYCFREEERDAEAI
jgi:hypothetical protein